VTAAADLLGELRCDGVDLRAQGDRLVVSGLRRELPGAVRAKLLAYKHELLELLAREDEERAASWHERELACYRAYVAALARAHSFDEESIALACEWMARRQGAFRVTPERIEIHLGEDIVAVVRPARARSAREDGNRTDL